jgi:protease-4
MSKQYPIWIVFITLATLLFSACAPRISLFPGAGEELKEFTLAGQEKPKMVIISVDGVISNKPKEGFMQMEPSMVQGIAAQLDKAASDPQVKAVILKIDTPGGSATASDILYHEIMQFKKRSGAKVVVAMMNLATSGGYYIALPADRILAHPTTVTGSIGVIFMRPAFGGLMEKVGLEMRVHKSGKNKDMGSPFRETTNEEEQLFQGLTMGMADRFTDLVAKHRPRASDHMERIKTARVFLADEALKIGLVDQIGYLSDVIAATKEVAQLPAEARLVVYRRVEYKNDNVYNSRVGGSSPEPALIDTGLSRALPPMDAGFYYIWSPAVGGLLH